MKLESKEFLLSSTNPYYIKLKLSNGWSTQSSQHVFEDMHDHTYLECNQYDMSTSRLPASCISSIRMYISVI